MANRKTATQMLAEACGKPFDEVLEDSSRTFYLSPDEAVAYGLIDKVIYPPPRPGLVDAKCFGRMVLPCWLHLFLVFYCQKLKNDLVVFHACGMVYPCSRYTVHCTVVVVALTIVPIVPVRYAPGNNTGTR